MSRSAAGTPSPAAGRVAARWQELAAAFRAEPGLVAGELDRLVSAYTGPGRHYHDIAHIGALLELSGAHRASLRDPSAVDLAILYHDAVYDPTRRDNEEMSAALARDRLGALGVAASTIDQVAALIVATKHTGAAAAGDGDLDHLLDLDLSILAAEPAAYDAYAAAIRREYAMYADGAYAQGRAAVLRGLLAQPALYRVPALAAAWEARARANLARELARYR